MGGDDRTAPALRPHPGTVDAAQRRHLAGRALPTTTGLHRHGCRHHRV